MALPWNETCVGQFGLVASGLAQRGSNPRHWRLLEKSGTRNRAEFVAKLLRPR